MIYNASAMRPTPTVTQTIPLDFKKIDGKIKQFIIIVSSLAVRFIETHR